MLVARRDAGALDLLPAALRAHADYTAKRPAPPVEVLARAIGALGPLARAVAPDLDAHLRLPETSPAAAAEIAKALVQLGAGESVPALRDFLTMYRADPGYERDPTALVAAAEALLNWAGRPIASCCCSWPRSRTPRQACARTSRARSARRPRGFATAAPVKVNVVVCRGPSAATSAVRPR